MARPDSGAERATERPRPSLTTETVVDGSQDILSVDIVCNLYTPAEVALRGEAVDSLFLGKVNVDAAVRGGISEDELIRRMDAGSVELAFLPAVKAGDRRLRDSY